MRNCIVKVLLLFSMLYLASCELSSFDDENKNKEEQTEGENTEGSEENDEEQNPEELPEFCDVHTIEGWTNVRFCKNGIVIFTKNFDGTQSVNKALMFVPSEECGITSIYGEYDESGMPKYLSFDDAVVFVEDYKDGLVDLSLVQSEECMWAAEDLELDAREAVSVSTRAWQDNNWVRNTCAIGGLVTSAIGVGAGVAVSSSGVGLVGGLLMIGASSKALADNFEVLFGPGDDGNFEIGDYAVDQLQGIGMETMVDVLTDNKESYLKTLWPDKFNFKNGLPDTPNTFWVDLTLDVVDAKWGKTITEATKRRAFLNAHLGYQIVTGRADDIKQSSATLYGYVSPEALAPLGKFADVEYGIVLYPTEDENARINESYYSAEGGLFSISFID